jgi:hypothetical protein
MASLVGEEGASSQGDDPPCWLVDVKSMRDDERFPTWREGKLTILSILLAI